VNFVPESHKILLVEGERVEDGGHEGHDDNERHVKVALEIIRQLDHRQLDHDNSTTDRTTKTNSTKRQLESSRVFFFFLEAFCNITRRLGRITPFGVFSDAFSGLKMWVTFACATANFLTHFIISIAVLENVPPDAGLQKRDTFPH
jgi:hypothetical protein